MTVIILDDLEFPRADPGVVLPRAYALPISIIAFAPPPPLGKGSVVLCFWPSVWGSRTPH